MRSVGILLVGGLGLAPLTGRAQDSTTTAPDHAPLAATSMYRDPRIARRLGTALPGAGHLYASEYVRGYFTWVGAVLSFSGTGYVYSAGACALNPFAVVPDDGKACDPGPRWQRTALAAVMAAIGVGVWVSSARDAPRAAERANARRQRRAARLVPLVAPLGGPAGAPGSAPGSSWLVGLLVHW